MDYTFSPIIIPLLIGAVMLLGLIFFTAKNLSKTTSIPFLLMLAAFLEWTVFYIMEISAGTLELKILWANFQFIGIGAAPLLWLITILELTGHRQKPGKTLLCVSLIPVATLVLAFTDQAHNLFREAPALVRSGSALLLHAEYGVWMNYIFIPYQYILYGFSILVLLYARRSAKSPYRTQYLMLITASLIPIAGSSLYTLGVPPFEDLNPASFLFVISSLVVAQALFKYNVLDIIPIARETVLENMKDAMIVLDNSYRLLDYNPAAKTLFPQLKTESIGLSAEQLFEREKTLVEQITKDIGENEIDFSMDNNTQGRRHFRSALSNLTSRGGRELGKVLIISDITAQINLLRRMEWLATTDELTRLNNRRAFFQRATMEMERARRYGRPISFILMDLDHFKRVNDSYGHAAGDEVLKETARRIRSSIRDTDIAGRYGGEEFAVCLPETPQHTAEQFAERLRVILSEKPFKGTHQDLSITASFGIIGRDSIDEETIEDLFAKADKALYLAKAKGRNLCIPFT
ncbi:MAG: diguanylate cyclase, partial [Spirochaetaceae bacterium]